MTSILDSQKLKGFRLATLLCDLQGSRLKMKWPKGTTVKAKRIGRNTFIIERMKPRKPFTPLCSQLCSVPRRALKF